ncbi:MAG: TIGR04255 family protein [Phycisphaeraceae bacterium]|nr:TIGR04255 family protein [Phycisphaerae bacterium]MBX3393388.1 TIGR04255 family protein [Phycisphaeraceae bacterium]
MPEYLFPEVERVIYGKSPLVEVICQVRFPADLRIETTPPVDFQQRIRAQFPLLIQRNRAVLSAMPPDLAKAFESVMPPSGGSTTWEFNTEDGQHTLQLVRDTLTLISRNYRRWEDFSGLFRGPFAALNELYSPQFYTRVGLRYRDIIQRSNLGLVERPWTGLLEPHVLAEIAQPGFEARTEEAFRNVLLKLPDQGAKVRLQHGFAEVEGSTEQVYLIDCDFFVERTEIANVDGALQYFHGNAARFFRWCISDSLHQAMEPGPVA